jgi:hypothetical protein
MSQTKASSPQEPSDLRFEVHSSDTWPQGHLLKGGPGRGGEGANIQFCMQFDRKQLWGLRQPSCAYMQFAVIYTSFAVMGYKALHGVTYFLRLSCGNIAVSGCNW